MGLGIYSKSFIPKKKFKFFTKTYHVLKSIQNHLLKNSEGIFRDFLKFEYLENQLLVTIHPSEEPIYFEIEEDNYLLLSARTNSVGPGYHAYIVEIMDDLSKYLNLNWIWGDAKEEDVYFDETGYYKNRDFKLLQIEMLRWLRAISKHFNEEDTSNLKISLSLNSPNLLDEYYAISPLGRWDKSWFDKTRNGELENLMNEGQQFFIWWNKEKDGAFYYKTTLALLNVECPWHSPIDDKERILYSSIDKCLINAQKNNIDLSLVKKDWRTIKSYLSNDQEETYFENTPIGFRKHKMNFSLAGNWNIQIPGYYYSDIQDDTEIYWYGERTIRNTTYKNEKEYPKSEFKSEIDKLLKPETYKRNKEIAFENEKIIGKGYIYLYEEDDENYWILHGVKIDKNGLILSTICFSNESDESWAIDTWETINR